MLVTEEELNTLLARESRKDFAKPIETHGYGSEPVERKKIIIEAPIYNVYTPGLHGYPFIERAGSFLPFFKPLTEREKEGGYVNEHSKLRYVSIKAGLNFSSFLQGSVWKIKSLKEEEDLLGKYKLVLDLIESVLSSIKLSKHNGFTTEIRTLSHSIRKNDDDKDFPKTAMKENLKVLTRSLFFTLALSPTSLYPDEKYFYWGSISFNLSWWLWLLSDLHDKQNEILNKRLLSQLKKFTQEDLDKFSARTFRLQDN